MPWANDNSRYLARGPAVAPEAPPPTPRAGVLDTMEAAFRSNNAITNFYENNADTLQQISNQPLSSTIQLALLGAYRDRRDPTYDPLGDIDGYDRYWREFIGSESPEETARIKMEVDRELGARKLIDEAGPWGLAASFAAGIADPATLASLAIPGGGELRAARMVASMVGTNAAIDTASEFALHQLQHTRTKEESAFNIGAGAILTGTLGSVAARMDKRELDRAISNLSREMYGPVNTSGSTVGAAAMGANTTLEQEAIAGVGEALSKSLGRISPVNRVLNSNSKLARQVVQDLVEVSPALAKNAEGIATPIAVETLVKRYDSVLVKIINGNADAYKSYRTRVKAAGEPLLNRSQFNEAVSAAMRRGDQSVIPEVTALASRWRSELIEPFTKDLQKAGLLRDPVKVAQAQLDEEVVGNYYSQELRKIVDDFIERGGDGSEVVAIRSLKTLTANAAKKIERAHAKAIAQGEQGAAKKAIDDINAELATEIDKIKPALIARLDNRAKAVIEGRATDADPGVNALATLMKKRADNEILDKLVPRKQTDVKGFDVVGAQSYLPRLYNIQRIKNDIPGFDAAVVRWFESEGVETAEAKGIAADVRRIILGSTRGFTTLDPTVVVKAGNLQERTLRIPDEVLEPFLVNGVEKVLGQYVRTVAPQLELRRKFGDDDLALTDTIRKISDEYAILQNAAHDAKTKKALEDELRAVVRDVTHMRDRVLGKAGRPTDPDSMLVRGARLFRDYNYVRLLGGQVLSSIADLGRLVSQYGLVKTGATLARFATNLNRYKLAREDAKRMAIGLDWALNTRGATFAEIGEFAETRAEDISSAFTGAFSRVTGMATWNSTMKFLAASMQQDEVLKLSKTAKPSKRHLEQLASIGIDAPMLKRIAKEFDTHGVDEGLRRARSELWTDKEAATVFESAILKASDIAILTKGAGDTPLFLSSEVGKTLLQFKSFGLAAVNRLLIPAAQGLQRGDVAMLNGMSLMLALGVLRYVLKQWTADQPIDTSPSTLIREAIDGGGFASYLPDVYDPIASATGLPRFSRYTDRNPIETALGPTFGTGTDLFQTMQGLAKDGVQPADVHRVRKLLPLQNLFYIRRAVNSLEESIAE